MRPRNARTQVSLQNRLQQDMQAAIRDRDELRRDTLRMVVSAAYNAQKQAGRELTDDEVISVLTREVKTRRESVQAFSAGGRAEAAAKALGQGKVVVFFFTRPGTPDDSATAAAVRSLHGMKNVAVFKANLSDIATYRPMLQNVGISEVPAVVVVRPGQRAVLFQGYVDGGTLRQNVADALR